MSKPKVFVVDDDQMFTTFLSDHLKSQKYEVLGFATGEECLENLHENPEIILLDYYLNSEVEGAKNGLEILEEIKKSNTHIKVVMLSSQEKYGVAAQTIARGASHYVIKGKEAIDEIDRILEGITS